MTKIIRELEMSATVGDYANGDGAKINMDAHGVYIVTDERTGARTSTMDWAVWDAIVAEVARYRAAAAAAEADLALVPVERRA